MAISGMQWPAKGPCSADPSSAFVVGSSSRSLLNRRLLHPTSDDAMSASPVVMHGSSRRQNRYNYPKKLHPSGLQALIRWKMMHIPLSHGAFSAAASKEPTLERWSQTLKLTFPEGEDDVVTEEEVKEYFTTDEYAPEAVIVGHQLPHEEIKHAYVHFSTDEACKKARKEKDGGSIGKASEVKVVYTDEKKWIRLRDGVSLYGGKRSRWMKAYGDERQPEYADDFDAPTGIRRHPVYPA